MENRSELLNWKLHKELLQLKYTWKISRNSSDFKTNFIISVSDGSITGKGEAAPNQRFDESPEITEKEFEEFLKNGAEEIETEEELQQIFEKGDFSNAFKFAVSSSFIHYLCKKTGKPVHEFLGIPKKEKIQTSYTLPIMPPADLEGFVREHRLFRFKTLKLKISQETALPLLRELRRFSSQTIRLDANESWKDPDQLAKFLEEIKYYSIQFLEQPFPSDLKEEYQYLKKVSPIPIMGDESVTDHAEPEEWKKQFHAVNMKLMKAGSYRKGIEILTKAGKAGLDTMIGCMVESSIGIWSAMNLAGIGRHTDLDGSFLVKNEPYGFIEENEGLVSQTDSQIP